jgi:hypothetical protein
VSAPVKVQPKPIPPVKKATPKEAILWVVGALLVFGIFKLFTAGNSGNSYTPAAQDPVQIAATPYPAHSFSGSSGGSASSSQVQYEVIGYGTADLTYKTPDGDEQKQDVSLPWGRSFWAKSGQFVYLSAQSNTAGVGCRISVSGQLIKHADSTGQYSIASCSGSVP